MRKRYLIAANGEQSIREDIADVYRCVEAIESVLCARGDAVSILPLQKKDFSSSRKLCAKIEHAQPSCVVNLFEGFSDDASREITFARALERTGVPFTGNTAATLALCLDKYRSKVRLRGKKVPVPAGVLLKRYSEAPLKKIGLPLFIKPDQEDASVGITDDSLISSVSEFRSVVPRKLHEFPAGIMIEEFIPGAEYNVGFIGNGPYELLGISVLDYHHYQQCHPFLTYRAKWDTLADEYTALTPIVNQEIPDALRDMIITCAQKAGQISNCRGYFRVDLRQKGDSVYVLDINPNPDINKDSGFMRQAYAHGYTFEEVISKIIVCAHTAEPMG